MCDNCSTHEKNNGTSVEELPFKPAYFDHNGHLPEIPNLVMAADGNGSYEIVTHNDRSPKWYDKKNHRIKCCFCDDYLQLEPNQYECHYGPYICPSCDEAMSAKYEYTWKHLPGLNNPRYSYYDPKLHKSLFDHYKILCENLLWSFNNHLASRCPLCGSLNTPRGWVSKYHICRDCIKKLPGYEKGKIDFDTVGLIVEPCLEHGFYLTTQRNKNRRSCPACSEKDRTVHCELCGEKYVTKDMHIDRTKNGQTHNICDNCKPCLPGYNENNIDNLHVVHCSNCNKYVLVSHNFDRCPNCNSEKIYLYEIICECCHEKKYVDNTAKKICNDCAYENSLSQKVKEWRDIQKIPTIKIDDNIVEFPMANIVDDSEAINNIKVCQCCGRLYVAHSGDNGYCGHCKVIVNCNNCGENYIIDPKTYFDNINKNDGVFIDCCSCSCMAALRGEKLYEEKRIYNAPGYQHIPLEDTEDFDDIQYNNLRKEINDDNVSEFMNVPGVWYHEDSNGNIVNVHQTSNIGYEYVKINNRIQSALNGGFNLYSKMMDNGVDIGNFKSYIVEISSNLKRRFDVEAHFAIKNNAEYWNTAPGYQAYLTYMWRNS